MGVPQLMKLIPNNLELMVSPFIGGASFEIACGRKGIKIIGRDVFLPLVNFWKHAIANPQAVSERAMDEFPCKHEDLIAMNETYEFLEDDLTKAAVFYILNRFSFSGRVNSLSKNPALWDRTRRYVKRLANFSAPNLSVDFADFSETISTYKSEFLYLDPPYALKSNLYGDDDSYHKRFNHEKLATLLKQRPGHWLLSYNDCERVRDLYSGHKIKTLQWLHTFMPSNNRMGHEIVICSDGYPFELTSEVGWMKQTKIAM